MIFTLMPSARQAASHSRALACVVFLSVAMLASDRGSNVPPDGTGAGVAAVNPEPGGDRLRGAGAGDAVGGDPEGFLDAGPKKGAHGPCGC